MSHETLFTLLSGTPNWCSDTPASAAPSRGAKGTFSRGERPRISSARAMPTLRSNVLSIMGTINNRPGLTPRSKAPRRVFLITSRTKGKVESAMEKANTMPAPTRSLGTRKINPRGSKNAIREPDANMSKAKGSADQSAASKPSAVTGPKRTTWENGPPSASRGHVHSTVSPRLAPPNTIR